MLTIVVPGRENRESWDERKEEFVILPPIKEKIIQLEHSLISISKWESKYCKPFINTKEKTNEEMMDYIKFMTITPNVDPSVYDRLSEENIRDISQYMEAPMTATTIKNTNQNKRSGRFITSELIYCWMTQLNIPFECEKWHINRLMMLIQVCNEENKEPKKQSKRETAQNFAAINAANRKRFNSKG